MLFNYLSLLISFDFEDFVSLSTHPFPLIFVVLSIWSSSMDDVLHHASSVRTKSKRTWKPNSTRSHAKQCGVIGVHRSHPAAARMHAWELYGRSAVEDKMVLHTTYSVSWVSSHSSTSRHLIITLRWWWWSALTPTGHLHKSYVLCFWAIHGTALEASCVQVQANGGAPKLFLVPILSFPCSFHHCKLWPGTISFHVHGNEACSYIIRRGGRVPSFVVAVTIHQMNAVYSQFPWRIFGRPKVKKLMYHPCQDSNMRRSSTNG